MTTKFALIGKGTISERHIKAIDSIGGEICNYGCGNIAVYQLQNGKFCCSERYNSCPKIKEKIKEKWLIHPPRLGKKHTSHTKLLISKKIKEIWKSPNGIYNLPEIRENNRLSIIGKTHTKDGDIKISKKLKGKIKTEQHKQKLSIATKKSFKNNHILKENLSKRMKKWQCRYMLKKVKTISKEEFKLQNLVKEIFPTAVFHYKVLENRNFEVDIVILEHKIAIEYDGYYHFNSEESIKYHNERQKEIEKKGWKFIRYNIFHNFPDKEQVSKDIIGVL